MYEQDFKAALYEEVSQIYRYLLKQGAKKQDAEDIVQDTVYKYLLNMNAIEASKAKSWMYRVAINQYYDLYRKRKRTLQMMEKMIDEEVEIELPDELLLVKERQDHVQTILQQLPTNYQELLLLKYDLEMKYTEIAEVVDRSVSSVKISLHRARKQFIELYRRKPYE